LLRSKAGATSRSQIAVVGYEAFGTVRWCIGKATAIGMISNELGLPLRQIASNSYKRESVVR
jgi:hypothetical protein